MTTSRTASFAVHHRRTTATTGRWPITTFLFRLNEDTDLWGFADVDVQATLAALVHRKTSGNSAACRINILVLNESTHPVADNVDLLERPETS
jgi:hypothetical protein